MSDDSREARLRTAISDAIQDSMGSMMLAPDVLDEMVEAIVFAVQEVERGR